MPWSRCGRYYYRSVRVGPRVVREYVGGGLVGRLAAREDARRRAEREAQRQALREEAARLEALDAPLRELDSVCNLLARAALAAAGCHQHKRQWRRRRGMAEKTTAAPGDTASAGASQALRDLLGIPPNADPAAAQAAVKKFLDRCQAGDESTVPVLKDLLQNPATVDLLGGDLAAAAERRLAKAVSGQGTIVREAILAKGAQLRAELSLPGQSPVERLLVERAAACWLQLADADTRILLPDMPLPWKEHYRRRQDSAHRRFLGAVRTLAQVRRLAAPVLRPAPAPMPAAAGRCEDLPPSLRERVACSCGDD
jgi:hypothetical protein